MQSRTFYLRAILVLAVCVTAACAAKAPVVVELRPDEKIARIMLFENQRTLGEGELLERLQDPTPEVRARACLALGRVGRVEAADALALRLGDESGHVRATAAFALGLLEGNLPAHVVQALQTSLSDPNEEVRARVVEATGRRVGLAAVETIGRSARQWLPSETPYRFAEPTTTSSIREHRADLRRALYALAQLGGREASTERTRWLFELATDANGAPRFGWWPAVWSLVRSGATESAPLFYPSLEDSDPDLRIWGTRGLAASSAAGASQWVSQLLADPNEKVRIEAVRAAATLGLREQVPSLLRLLEGDSLYVQAEVLKALASLKHPDALDAAIDAMSSESAWLRALALPALARQDSESFWLLLSGLGDDAEWQAQKSLIEVLGNLGGRRPANRLRELADHQDKRVRTAALNALAKANPDGHGSLFLERLGAEDVFEREAAARAIGAAGKMEAAPELAKAFAADASSEPNLRMAILDALARMGDAHLRPVAEHALRSDTNWLTRRKAASMLGRDGTAEGPDAQGNFDHYLGLLDTPFTPQATIHTSRGSVELELFVLDAPGTVDNFIRLVEQGFYDGLAFHRVIPNFMVQTGDPRGDGLGGPGYQIRCEINRRPFLRGTAGMALSGKDSGGSQFFVTHLPQPHLDGRYTVFGQVTSGMDVIDRIQPGDRILSITVWDGFRMRKAVTSEQ